MRRSAFLACALLTFATMPLASCGGGEAAEGDDMASHDASGAAHGEEQAAPNRLTDAERAEGWRLLFDGASLEHWRGYKRDDVPASWSIEDGTVAFRAGDDRGDIVTRERFGDFELALEWRISPGGNSGIMFRATEDHDYPWESAPEMQVLDNAGHVDGGNPLTSAGANYALHAPIRDVTRPVGEWNQARLVVRGSHVEHWLNGAKVVEYELWTDDWKALVAGSKFSEMPDYGLARVGHVVLQDHDDPVWYRNIKIRPL